jgi:ribosome-associated toxin RatA of RatAB toxin-antitoxin module
MSYLSLYRRALCAFAAVILSFSQAVQAEDGAWDAEKEVLARLDAGEVVVHLEESNGIKFVAGKILIDESPTKVWPIMVNPFEYENKICPRLKTVQVFADEPARTVLGARIKVIFPIPDVCYVVESNYVANQRVDFHRVSGSFRDFRGYWSLTPDKTGNKTVVTYAMHLDPGVPIPDWLVRQGVRMELPSVLSGLRTRIHTAKHHHDGPPIETRNIQAASLGQTKTAVVPAALSVTGIVEPAKN